MIITEHALPSKKELSEIIEKENSISNKIFVLAFVAFKLLCADESSFHMNELMTNSTCLNRCKGSNNEWCHFERLIFKICVLEIFFYFFAPNFQKTFSILFRFSLFHFSCRQKRKEEKLFPALPNFLVDLLFWLPST